MLHTKKARGIAKQSRSHGSRGAKPEGVQKGGLALLFVLLVAQLMVILDITAVNIALPSLAEDLRMSGSDVSWSITSYSLIFGSLLLFGGRAADLLGRRMTGSSRACPRRGADRRYRRPAPCALRPASRPYVSA